MLMKYTTINIRPETKARLISKMSYGQTPDAYINYLLDKVQG
jgi:hypothetical protein